MALLDLERNIINESGAISLAVGLATNRSLAVLSIALIAELRFNNLRDNGAIAIAGLLKSSRTLKIISNLLIRPQRKLNKR